jgi:hypothetical protein
VAAGAGVVFAVQREVLHDHAAFAAIELVDYQALPPTAR